MTFGGSEVLVLVALLSVGVVYGTDVFFAVVGRPALARSGDASMAEVMGFMHLYGDARMPIFGALGLVATTALVFTLGFGSVASGWAALAVAGLGVQLGVYLTVARPVNAALKAAAQQNVTPADARALQRRWDSVITLRTLGCVLAVVGLTLAALSLPQA